MHRPLTVSTHNAYIVILTVNTQYYRVWSTAVFN